MCKYTVHKPTLWGRGAIKTIKDILDRLPLKKAVTMFSTCVETDSYVQNVDSIANIVQNQPYQHIPQL